MKTNSYIKERNKTRAYLEYDEPYRIERIPFSDAAIIFKKDKLVCEVDYPDFIIQVDKDEFFIAETIIFYSSERKDKFTHIKINENKIGDFTIDSFFDQNREMSKYDSLPSRRLGHRFVIPPYFNDESDLIYDTKLKKCIECLGVKRRVSITEIDGCEYYKIISKLPVSDLENEELISLLGPNDDYPKYAYRVKEQDIVSFATSEDMYALRKYYSDRYYELNKKYEEEKNKCLKLLSKKYNEQ